MNVGDEVEFIGMGDPGIWSVEFGDVGIVVRLRELGPSATVRWLDGSFNNVELESLRTRTRPVPRDGKAGPHLSYDPKLDLLQVFTEGESFVLEPVDDVLSVHRGLDSGKVMGFRIQGVSALISKAHDDACRKELEDVVKVYQEIVGSRFPGTKVRIMPSSAPEGEAPPYFLTAFMVPDLGKFMDFVLDELPAILESRKVAVHPIMQHGIEATKKYFPEEVP